MKRKLKIVFTDGELIAPICDASWIDYKIIPAMFIYTSDDTQETVYLPLNNIFSITVSEVNDVDKGE